MATATKITKQINAYTLELSEAEAITLANILVNVGGSDKTTLRKYADAVSKSLDAAGVLPWYDSGDTLDEDVFVYSPSLVFAEGSLFLVEGKE